MRTKALLVLVVISLMLWGAHGCDKIAEKAGEKLTEKMIEGDSGAEVDITDDGVSVTGQDGSTFTSTSGADLPKDWPDDVPIYDGKITTSSSSGDDDSAFYTLLVETDDKGSDVSDWYKSALEDEGWTVTFSGESSSGDDKTFTVVAEKGEWSATIGATEGTDKTEVTVMVGK